MTGPARHLGRYELVEQLGQGGMGEVWLARLTGAAGFEKPCLLKSVLPRLAGDKQFVERFQHEGKVLVHLQHANIAQVLDMGDAGGALYIALEYVMGVDLTGLHETVFRDGGQMPVPLALWICQQAAEGLAYAHGKSAPDGTALQIVHRDVSPHNLMVSYDGEVKVIDFGIARSSARGAQTQPQTVLGKIGYMAPEQARGEEVDARADQYALGIVLWELLTDQPYVRPGTVGEMMGSMANPKPRPVREYRPDVPAEVDGVLLRALAVQPGARFPRMADFSQALMAELARRYRMPNREELSAYVREKCSGQWQEHQQLLQRFTSGRRAATPATPAPQPLQRPRTSPGAQTRPSNVVPAKSSEAPTEPPPSKQAETRVSSPSRAAAPRVVARDAEATDPMPTPLVAPPRLRANEPLPAPLAPSTRVVERPSDPLSTDESLARVRASRAPMLTIAAVALALSAGAWWVLSREPTSVNTPHGPVGPKETSVPDAVGAETKKPLPMQLVLQGTVQFIESPAPSYVLNNTGNVRWTECHAVFPGKRRGVFDALAPTASRAFEVSKLGAEIALPELVGKVFVYCKQGSAALTFASQ